MKILDLFCGAGGASMGYRRAFGDDAEIWGVDLYPQPRYPFAFIQMDALTVTVDFLQQFDFIHASPPCQAYSDLAHRNKNGHMWPRLVEPIRAMLRASGKPYVIENVEGAPLKAPLVLCGTMFPGLRVLRHRLFECSFPVMPPSRHGIHPLVFTHDKRKKHYGMLNDMTSFVTVTGGGNCSIRAARDAMGIGWMNKKELNESIPPAYTEHVGKEFLKTLDIAQTLSDKKRS